MAELSLEKICRETYIMWNPGKSMNGNVEKIARGVSWNRIS